MREAVRSLRALWLDQGGFVTPTNAMLIAAVAVGGSLFLAPMLERTTREARSKPALGVDRVLTGSVYRVDASGIGRRTVRRSVLDPEGTRACGHDWSCR